MGTDRTPLRRATFGPTRPHVRARLVLLWIAAVVVSGLAGFASLSGCCSPPPWYPNPTPEILAAFPADRFLVEAVQSTGDSVEEARTAALNDARARIAMSIEARVKSEVSIVFNGGGKVGEFDLQQAIASKTDVATKQVVYGLTKIREESCGDLYWGLYALEREEAGRISKAQAEAHYQNALRATERARGGVTTGHAGQVVVDALAEMLELEIARLQCDFFKQSLDQDLRSGTAKLWADARDLFHGSLQRLSNSSAVPDLEQALALCLKYLSYIDDGGVKEIGRSVCVKLKCPGCAGAKQCPKCKGEGRWEKNCEKCQGRGEREVDCGRCSARGRVACDRCRGSGKVAQPCAACRRKGTAPCSRCRATGLIPCAECGGDGVAESKVGPITVRQGQCTACSKKSRYRVQCPDCGGKRLVPCPTCGGDGEAEGTCPTCNGSGLGAYCVACQGRGSSFGLCPDCKGGKSWETCDACRGTSVCPACQGRGFRTPPPILEARGRSSRLEIAEDHRGFTSALGSSSRQPRNQHSIPLDELRHDPIR